MNAARPTPSFERSAMRASPIEGCDGPYGGSRWRRFASVSCVLAAIGAALARSPGGVSYLPLWMELSIELAAALGWLAVRGVRARADSPRRPIDDVVWMGLVGVGSGWAALRFDDARLAGVGAAAYLVGVQGCEWLAALYRRIERLIDEPLGLARALLPNWLGMMAVGALVLALPIATQSGVPDYRHNFLNHLLDCLFSSVSAGCLVGVTVQSFGEDFTRLGQWVLVVMTHLSGLAAAAAGLAVIRPFLWRPIRFSAVVGTAAICLAIAMVVMGTGWHSDDAPDSTARLWWSVVHAGSALWNTGLSLRHDGLAAYVADFRITICVTALAIIGSLGLPILMDLMLPHPRKNDAPLQRVTDEHASRASLLRLRRMPEWDALAATLFLGLGAALLWYFDHPMSRTSTFAPPRALESLDDRIALSDFPPSKRWSLSLLVSATLRSAGIQSIPVAEGTLTWLSFGLMLTWMAIGGSAAGVAGGMRTSAISLIVALRAKGSVGRDDIAGARLRRHLVRSAAVFAAAWLGVNGMAIAALFAVTDGRAYECMIEGVAAVNGVGLSTGLAPHLTPIGRLVMIGLFLLSRVGPTWFWLRTTASIHKMTSTSA